MGFLFKRVEEALAATRKIVYVSMGTVITGDDASNGWTATSGGAMTGKQLCQCVYRSVFAELGCSAQAPLLSKAPLVVVSLGPQPDALDGISVPENSVCF